MKIDFTKFKQTLPYSSEMYGIYQPLLGWKSQMMVKRIQSGLDALLDPISRGIEQQMLPQVISAKVTSDNNNPFGINITSISPALFDQKSIVMLNQGIDSFIARGIYNEIVKRGIDLGIAKFSDWQNLINGFSDDPKTGIDFLLKKVADFTDGDTKAYWKDKIINSKKFPVGIPSLINNIPSATNASHVISSTVRAIPPTTRGGGWGGFDWDPSEILNDTNSAIYAFIVEELKRESIIAGTLKFMLNPTIGLAGSVAPMISTLNNLFKSPESTADVIAMMQMNNLIDPLESFDPKSDLDKVHLSPLGIIHLFRQYFFEFDSFLGPSVQHIWLSPGSSLELIEVSTRKTIIERTTEQSFESTIKSEKSLTDQDELSDAVKEDNKNNTSFGVSVNNNESGSTLVFSSSVSATSNYNVQNSVEKAKEQTHKQLRQQSTKLSSEIKKNYKSTFKTITETTDTSSKRYVLQNSSNDLRNYELRRKMRQVGVQVQDLGTQLCWQTYIDTPGDQLGIGKLVHVASPGDLDNLHFPEKINPPAEQLIVLTDENFVTGLSGDTPFQKVGVDPPARKKQYVPPDGFDVVFKSEDDIQTQLLYNSSGATQARWDKANSMFDIWFTGVANIQQGEVFSISITFKIAPTSDLIIKINAANDTAISNYNADKQRLTKEAFYTSAKERIKLAANIQPRPSDDLRNEERIIIYRNLIAKLFATVGISNQLPSHQHVLAELVESMFDTDNMLYFVAPEWWLPHAPKKMIGKEMLQNDIHKNPQNIGINPQSLQGTGIQNISEFEQENVIGWGGTDALRPDSYYITEDSVPAKLGSSLGWTLQLDGDNLRNAFLNAPWVKAVIPVRLGNELDALNWLKKESVEGADGLETDNYLEGQSGEINNMLAFLKLGNFTDQDLNDRYGTNKATSGSTPIAASDFKILDAVRYLALKVQEKHQVSQVKVNDPTDPGNSYLPMDTVFEFGFDPLQGGFEAQGTDPFKVFDQWVEIMPTDQIVAVEVTYDPKTGMQI